MRDTLPTILLPGNPSVAEALREQDRAVEYGLHLMNVRVYLNAIARGHRNWADRAAPKTWQLVDFQNYIDLNEQDPGHQYKELCGQLIQERLESKRACRSLVVKFAVEAQDCY